MRKIIIFFLICLSFYFQYSSSMAYEEAPYNVVHSTDTYEIIEHKYFFIRYDKKVFRNYLFQETLNITSFLLIIGNVKGPLYVALIAGPLIFILSSISF